MTERRNEFDEKSAIFEIDEAALDARERKAMADMDAGRYVSHEAVVRWLKSWGTDNPLPPPKCGD